MKDDNNNINKLLEISLMFAFFCFGVLILTLSASALYMVVVDWLFLVRQ